MSAGGHLDAVVRCQLGGVTYGLAPSHVLGIRRLDEVRRNPAYRPGRGLESPLGWISTQGVDVRVVPLSTLLGTSSGVTTQDDKVIVVSSASGDALGLVVDRVLPMVSVPASRVFPVPRSAASEAFALEAVLLLEDDVLAFLLSPQGLLGSRAAAASRSDAATASPVDLTRPADDGEGAAGQVVLFRGAGVSARGSFLLGLSARQVLEVAALPEVVPVPGAPSAVMGLGVLRARPVPVLDLGRLLGRGPGSLNKSQARWLVARPLRAEEPVGLVVAAGLEIVRLPLASRPAPLPTGFPPELALGAFETPKGLVVMLDLDQI